MYSKRINSSGNNLYNFHHAQFVLPNHYYHISVVVVGESLGLLTQ